MQYFDAGGIKISDRLRSNRTVVHPRSVGVSPAVGVVHPRSVGVAPAVGNRQDIKTGTLLLDFLVSIDVSKVNFLYQITIDSPFVNRTLLDGG